MTEGFRQQCLLLAWAHIESAACEEGAASSLLWERNEITHAMEAGTSLEQVLCKAEDFPRLSQKFLELQGSNPTSLDLDLAAWYFLVMAYGFEASDGPLETKSPTRTNNPKP